MAFFYQIPPSTWGVIRNDKREERWEGRLEDAWSVKYECSLPTLSIMWKSHVSPKKCIGTAQII